MRPRIGYCWAPQTVLADERLLRWSEVAGLRCAAPEVPTWTSYNEQRHAVLDCFFWKSRSGGAAAVSAAMAFSSPDPRHDHRGVRIALQMDGMAAIPPAESLWRPLRLKMQCWEKKREDWQKEVERILAGNGSAGVGRTAKRPVCTLASAQTSCSCLRSERTRRDWRKGAATHPASL
jgi:hypothetical protein